MYYTEKDCRCSFCLYPRCTCRTRGFLLPAQTVDPGFTEASCSPGGVSTSNRNRIRGAATQGPASEVGESERAGRAEDDDPRKMREKAVPDAIAAPPVAPQMIPSRHSR